MHYRGWALGSTAWPGSLLVSDPVARLAGLMGVVGLVQCRAHKHPRYWFKVETWFYRGLVDNLLMSQ